MKLTTEADKAAYEVGSIICAALDELNNALFGGRRIMTLLIRDPQNPNQTFIASRDTHEKIIEALNRANEEDFTVSKLEDLNKKFQN